MILVTLGAVFFWGQMVVVGIAILVIVFLVWLGIRGWKTATRKDKWG